MPDIRTCAQCQRSFEAITVGGGMTSPEPEDLKCPYCGSVRKVLSSGRFITRPLPEGATPADPDPKAPSSLR